uniref:Uncharacterized protein n=1 Tax=Anopheles melas TaxID=34690 RepID=A0A182U5H0_9DIPT
MQIQDSSLGGSSDDEDLLGVLRGPSSFANAFLYTKQPQIYPKSIVKTKTYEGVEALRQIATTSLFLQNEQKVSSNRIVPIIKEPEKLEEPPLELKKLESRKDEAAIVSISDGEDDSHRKQAAAQHHASDTQVIDLTGEDQDDEQSHSPSSGTSHQRKDSKLRRQRTSVHQQKPARELQSSAYGGSAGHNTAPSEPSSLLMETSLMIIGPTPLSSPTKAANATPPTRTPGGTLTVPTQSANGSAVHGAGQPGNKTATSSTTPGNLLTLPAAAAAATASSTAGSAGGPTVSFAGSTLLPGQLSPLPSTSYLPSSSVAGGYRSSSTSSPLPGFMPSSVSPHYHSNSSSSSSNYVYSPPPFTQHAEPTAHGTNTITAAASTTLLHAPTVSSNKTEPELVLSPSKLGQ